MHHKFLVIDKNILISGSSNWTSTAFAGNWDNIIVTSVPALVTPFSQHFSQLWAEFSEMDHKLQVWVEGQLHAPFSEDILELQSDFILISFYETEISFVTSLNNVLGST